MPNTYIYCKAIVCKRRTVRQGNDWLLCQDNVNTYINERMTYMMKHAAVWSVVRLQTIFDLDFCYQFVIQLDSQVCYYVPYCLVCFDFYSIRSLNCYWNVGHNKFW